MIKIRSSSFNPNSFLIIKKLLGICDDLQNNKITIKI